MSMSIAVELERLTALRDSGAISEAEFARAKAHVLNSPQDVPPDAAGPLNVLNQLRRSRSDSVLGGICGGLGRYTGVPAWGWRVLFCLSVMCFGFGILLYCLLWLFIPLEA
jgi:phage shock protein C